LIVCLRPTDLRQSLDGLLGLVSEVLAQDPLSGHLFVLVNRHRAFDAHLSNNPKLVEFDYSMLPNGRRRGLTEQF
jgi:hypothetical protein